MNFLGKYNQAKTLIFPLVDAVTDDLKSGITFAAGDVKIIKDEAAAANTTNLPSDEGSGIYSLVLTATEMQAARIAIVLVDQTSPKVWRDQAILVEVYGNASAEHAFDLDSATVTPTDGSITAAVIADNAIDDAAMAADLDAYTAKVWLFDDDSAGTPTDRYTAVWYQNGSPVAAGSISSPAINVFKAADGTDLIASSAMTQITGQDAYKYDATAAARIADGAAYIAKVTATIGGATRTWYQPVGRDS